METPEDILERPEVTHTAETDKEPPYVDFTSGPECALWCGQNAHGWHGDCVAKCFEHEW